jgi:four helix bundle protein
MIVKKFEELEVYQLALELQRQIFALSKRFPKDEQYSLTDQIRRSSRSVGANIAEAWHKRRYTAHFVSKLTDADGEAAETRHWLQTANDSGYLDEGSFKVFIDRYHVLGAKLGRMIQDASSWKPR